MKAKKVWLIVKTTGETFTLGASVATVILGVLTAFVSVPLVVMFPIVGVTGVVFGIAGTYYAIKELNKKKLHKLKRKIENYEKYKDSRPELSKRTLLKLKKYLGETIKETNLEENITSTPNIFSVFPPSLDSATQTSDNHFPNALMKEAEVTVVNDSIFAEPSVPVNEEKITIEPDKIETPRA